MIIGRLRGEVAALAPGEVVVDVGGVGYSCQAGSRTVSALRTGEDAVLYVETRVSESSIALFAFLSDAERSWFVRLQDVPGVAGKAAMAVLDALDVAELMDAIALQDAATLSRAKGIGKKLAERIVGELHGKPPPVARFVARVPARSGGTDGADVAPNAAPAPSAPASLQARKEAVSALAGLGYADAEAARAVAAALRAGTEAETGALIRAALQELAP